MIERAGVKLQYQMPGLKEPSTCDKEDCFLNTTGGKGDRRKEGLVYKGTCLREAFSQKSGLVMEFFRKGSEPPPPHPIWIGSRPLPPLRNNSINNPLFVWLP